MNFAREVTENKSMDNAINRLQDMFTTVDPVQNVGVAKRGADTSSRSPVTMLAAGSGGLTGDMTGKSGSEVQLYMHTCLVIEVELEFHYLRTGT